MVHVIIFSKNRACQLDSLLRSIRDNWREPDISLHVLYAADNEQFRKGYALLKSREYLGRIQWYAQTDFRQDLLVILDRIPDTDYLMFLVDDDIIYCPVRIGPVLNTFNRRHLFVSLRASTAHSSYPKPPFRMENDDVLEWKWNFCKNRMIPWNYPFSLDGNILRAAVIKKTTRSIQFAAPNSYEAAMHRYRHRWWVKRIPRALAPAKPVVFNNPLNRVQTEGETWHRDMDAGYLNEEYLSGMQIDNELYYNTCPTNVHYSVDLRFESGCSAGRRNECH